MDDSPPDDFPPDDIPVRSKLEQTAWVVPAVNTQRYLLSAVMGDHSGSFLRKCSGLTVDAFTDPLSKKLWKFVSPGVNGHTPKEIAAKVYCGEKEIKEIQSLDPTGDNFEKHLSVLRQNRREAIRAKISISAASFEVFDPTEITSLVRELTGMDEISAPKLKSTPLTAFTVPPKDDKSVLLGNRYLNRGDGGIIVSSSGMGKSSLYVLAAVMWALGRDFFGIKPNGPLRSLLVQSEDSDGDVAEVWFSIAEALQLSKAEIQQVTERVLVVTDRIHRGAPFISELKRHVAAFKPDIVWINPLVAFIDGDVKEAADAGSFLREGLNGLNADAEFAYIIIHHTTKPPNSKDTKERNWSEIMYDMAGSYDLIGWARFIISLRPTPKPGEFNMVLAKRGRRAGVVKEVDQGAGWIEEVSTVIPMRHSTDKLTLPTGDKIFSLMWHVREPDAPPPATSQKEIGRPRLFTWPRVAEFVPLGEDKAITVGGVHRAAADATGIKINTLRDLLDDSYRDGLVKRIMIAPTNVLKYFR